MFREFPPRDVAIVHVGRKQHGGRSRGKVEPFRHDETSEIRKTENACCLFRIHSNPTAYVYICVYIVSCLAEYSTLTILLSTLSSLFDDALFSFVVSFFIEKSRCGRKLVKGRGERYV